MSKKPSNVSPSEYSRLEVGKTDDGLLIRCKRCDKDVSFYAIKWAEDQICQCDKCKEGV
jgi:hypothetical protein